MPVRQHIHTKVWSSTRNAALVCPFASINRKLCAMDHPPSLAAHPLHRAR